VGGITIVHFILMQARSTIELEVQLSPSPGGKAGGIPLVNFSALDGTTIVNFSFDVGKISAILRAGGPAEPQS
jgi:hypothetical protein